MELYFPHSNHGQTGYNASSPLKFNRRFGEICRLHLQDRRINQERYVDFGYIMMVTVHIVVFWVVAPCILIREPQHFKDFSTMKMETACSSETLRST
jgi:hypothetical protein